MTDDGLRIERSEAVLRLTIDRPDRLNALTPAIVEQALAEVEAASGDGTRVIVLTGAGRAFSSGADVGPDGAPPGLQLLDLANAFTLALTGSPCVVIAAVNGIAAGVGCSFALAADLTIAKESASFMLAFTRIGLMPDGGASLLVPAAVGRARAARMALLAEKIPARQAAEWGLIAEVVADEDFDARIEELVEQTSSGAPLAYAATKRTLNEATLGDLRSILAAERERQGALLTTADFAEGIAAFQDKRTARFSGT
jgi:enoyl-CoA hydratase/carnithine racemase